MGSVANAPRREPWNKGKIVGQKAPFKPKDIWALRVRLQMEGRIRELALFNLGIEESPLPTCWINSVSLLIAPMDTRPNWNEGSSLPDVMQSTNGTCAAGR